MMRDEEDVFYGFLTGLILGGALFYYVGYSVTSRAYQNEAINLDYAEYNAVDGEWQWKEKDKQ